MKSNFIEYSDGKTKTFQLHVINKNMTESQQTKKKQEMNSSLNQ